ncbi:GGDEF domain-containing protein [Eubacteriaceae bacterium ES2]|nr:GGDEF domain-containing protein [Eubacteriaceae bacterium ES2]
MTLVSFLMIHAIIWGNIWMMSLHPDQSFANAGFLMMSFFLLMISFGTPPFMAMIGQAGLIVDILVANLLYQYPDINIILASNWSIIILFFFVDLIGTHYFYDSYLTSKKLDFALLHDPLTQVFNRRKLDDLMGPSHDLSFMSSQIGLLIMDIDHFKRVNDTFGHDEGDRILQFTADCIRNSLRDKDLVIRWGGEEFTAILFDCPTEQIRQTAERIRATIEQSDNSVCPVTISIGTKIYSGGDCINEIKLADQALYAAKNDGRNRVVAYEEIQDLAFERD